jgi:hypothetical protein
MTSRRAGGVGFDKDGPGFVTDNAPASLLRRAGRRRPLQWIALYGNLVVRNARQVFELGLVGIQFFFDEGLDHGPENFVRDLLHHVGAHFLQDPRDQGFYV